MGGGGTDWHMSISRMNLPRYVASRCSSAR
jgi:hypothetical protein